MANEISVCSEYVITANGAFDSIVKISTPLGELGTAYLSLPESVEGDVVHIAAAKEILADPYVAYNARRYADDRRVAIWPMNAWKEVKGTFRMPGELIDPDNNEIVIEGSFL
jgi:hypothetical protein